MAHLKYPDGIVHLCRQRVVTDYTEKPHFVPGKNEAVARILATVADRSRCSVERDAA
jgi:hypothetical protein